jgi:hypothetical protein
MATVCEWFGLKTTWTVSRRFDLKIGGDGLWRFGFKTYYVSFLVEPQNQVGGGFPSLGLKTGSYDLMICASKSLRQFLGLDLKTKQTSVCRLCHKIDGGRSARNMRRDLVTCFAWKQVWLGFSSLS